MTSPELVPLRPPSPASSAQRAHHHATRIKWDNIGIIGAGIVACCIVVALIVTSPPSQDAGSAIAPRDAKALHSAQVVGLDAQMATTPEQARALMVTAQALVDQGKYDEALEVLTHIDAPLDAEVGAVAMRDRIDALRVRSDQLADAAAGAAGQATDVTAASGTDSASAPATSTSSDSSSSSAADTAAPSSSAANGAAAATTPRPTAPTRPSSASGTPGSRPIAGTGALPPELQALYDSADPQLIAQVQAMVASADPKSVADLENTIARLMATQAAG